MIADTDSVTKRIKTAVGIVTLVAMVDNPGPDDPLKSIVS
jgi:hypothetical protein